MKMMWNFFRNDGNENPWERDYKWYFQGHWDWQEWGIGFVFNFKDQWYAHFSFGPFAILWWHV